MSYLGNTPTTALYAAKTDVYSGDGSTVNFTLTREVTNTEDLEVLVNNVQQSTVSGDAYTVSGTTLSFTEAPSSGTNNISVTYRNNVITRIIPEDDTISAVMLQANSVTTTKIADDAVTAAKLADTAVAAANYGGADQIATITVDAQGRLTYAANVAIETGFNPFLLAGL